jgi:hypothetical protein
MIAAYSNKDENTFGRSTKNSGRWFNIFSNWSVSSSKVNQPLSDKSNIPLLWDLIAEWV